MKVLHISTYPWGGAFNGTYRLHKALLSSGIDSKILVNHEPINANLDNVHIYNTPKVKTTYFNRLTTKLGFPTTFCQKKSFYSSTHSPNYEIITFPFSDYDITNSIHYKNADVINIHWIADFLDYKSFFKKVNKPIAWTLRDLSPLQGIFHYEEDITRNIDTLGDVEGMFTSYKRDAIKRAKVPISVIGISNWITKQSKSNKIFEGFPHHTIPNCINVDDFPLLEKAEAKRKLNIKADKIIFSFASDDLLNPRKGLDLLYEAILRLPMLEDVEVLTFGGGTPPVFPLQVIHRHFGHLGTKDLGTVMCASDAFIFPTREEALGNVMLEAMACGTPVIGTKVGGLVDVIKPGFNGIFLDEISSENLSLSMMKFIEVKESFCSEAIREFIVENFSEKNIVEQYMHVYKSLLNSY
ncbi:glycosyltransferase [Pontibacter locisalis]|uniref:Glycosyltransferase n=1 Tax=Pontibacter locisalis TaxID=1719035 RepID=A0ABW5IPQ0_9BACT